MCLIVDANAAHKMFAVPPHSDAVPAMRWIHTGGGCLVYGGYLTRELGKIHYALKMLTGLKRAGRAFEENASKMNAETKSVNQTQLCVSDDTHIVALARLTGARVLFSHDKKLHTDFGNKRLIDKPRGRIYQDEEHEPLLGHSANCVGRPSRRARKRTRRSP